jgi:hypothetical protein
MAQSGHAGDAPRCLLSEGLCCKSRFASLSTKFLSHRRVFHVSADLDALLAEC